MKAKHTLGEWQGARRLEDVNIPQISSIHPAARINIRSGWKCNIDAAVFSESNASGFGAILNFTSSLPEDKAVDLYVLERALLSMHSSCGNVIDRNRIVAAYKKSSKYAVVLNNE
ncbi:hypothetical protein ACFE04_012223 [Oxalis oulophora]